MENLDDYNTLAWVYAPGQNISVTTTPGRKVHFRGGKATVHDRRDMVHLLRDPRLTIQVNERWVEWVPKWMHDCGELKTPQAQIVLPAGYRVEGAWPDYHLVGPQEEVVESEPKKRRGPRTKQDQQTSPDAEEQVELANKLFPVQDGAGELSLDPSAYTSNLWSK